MGSLEHPLLSLYVEGSVRADGDGFSAGLQKNNASIDNFIGPGGGSGGTILLFVHSLDVRGSGNISSAGGHGSLTGGGGGGGGRIHFHWSDIPTGDVYWPVATVNGTIHTGLVHVDTLACKVLFSCVELLWFLFHFLLLFFLASLMLSLNSLTDFIYLFLTYCLWEFGKLERSIESVRLTFKLF